MGSFATRQPGYRVQFNLLLPFDPWFCVPFFRMVCHFRTTKIAVVFFDKVYLTKLSNANQGKYW